MVHVPVPDRDGERPGSGISRSNARALQLEEHVLHSGGMTKEVLSRPTLGHCSHSASFRFKWQAGYHTSGLTCNGLSPLKIILSNKTPK